MPSAEDRALEVTGSGGSADYGFGEVAVRHGSEVGKSALSESAKAEVEARYIMAERHPRDIELFRTKLLKECSRPGFADMCEYARPVGWDPETKKQKIATGPTVHLIRAALRAFNNTVEGSRVIENTSERRVTTVVISDYENNHHLFRDITVERLIEKKAKVYPQKGGKSKVVLPQNVVSSRKTSVMDPETGELEVVYLCGMTLDECRKEEARQVALAKRALGEEMLPRDIIQEAIGVARATIERKIAEDPDAARRNIIDSFDVDFNVGPEALAELLGHTTATVNPVEIKTLRGVYSSMKEGVTWQEVMQYAETTKKGSDEEAAKVLAQKLGGNQKPPAAADAAAMTTPQQQGNAGAGSNPPITEEQTKAFIKAIEDLGVSDEDVIAVLKQAGVERVDHIPASVYKTLLTALKGKGTKK